MYGNGAATGMTLMAAVRRPTLLELLPVISVFFGVVVGPTLRGAAECRIGATSIRPSGAPTSVCVLSFFSLCVTYVETLRATSVHGSRENNL